MYIPSTLCGKAFLSSRFFTIHSTHILMCWSLMSQIISLPFVLFINSFLGNNAVPTLCTFFSISNQGWHWRNIKGQLISKANYDVFDSSKKRTKHTQDTILSVFRSFFGRVRDFMVCFPDLLTFRTERYFSGLYLTYDSHKWIQI